MNTYRTIAFGTKCSLLFSRQFWFAILLFALLVAPSSVRGALLVRTVTPPTDAVSVRPSRILVKPRAGADLGALHALLGTRVLQSFPAIGGLQIVELPAGSLVATVLGVFQQSGLVSYAEADSTVHILAEPNDFRFYDGSLWAMKNTGQLGGTPGADIKAPQGWDLQTDASPIIVAVVDTGIRMTHEDLAGNLWTNSAEVAGNGADDDHDGFVDDVHGINAITHTGDPTDDHGHGSHVSGTIGAVGNNSVGVVGVAWKVQIMACKFIDSQGNGAISDAVTCIDYARAHHANIINASWGDPSYASAALHDAIASARTAGILFVAACGNSQGNNDTTPLYPASYNQQLDNVISVASTNRNDGLSFFSNFGAHTVDLGSPGEGIFSCWGGNDSDYRFDSGTSMAAAHVSGVAAVVMAHTPGIGYAATKQTILSNTDPLPSLQGKVATGGRLNLFRALGTTAPPPTVPLPPSNLTATAASTSTINLTWTDNASNEQGFQVERSADGVTFSQIASPSANVTSYSDTGLTASTTYYYRVRAYNSAGTSAYSNTANATTAAPAPTPPAAPSGLTATATSSSAINLTWTDNADNESGFIVERSTDNTTFAQIAAPGANTTSYGDTGLTANTTYYYRVRATNSAGASANSNTASATTQAAPPPPPQAPAAPSSLSATTTSSSAISLTWSDNSDNEQGFQVERSTDNATFMQIASPGANAASYSDTGLTASTTYYYRVRAFNAAGNSAYSNTASATTQAAPPPPPQVPAAPSNLSATATSSSAISLTWSDNSDNEQGFKIERSTDNTTFAQVASLGANTTSYSDAGLTASTTYYYRVRGFNGAGNSDYSNTASATTLAQPPPPPPAKPTLTASAPASLASKIGPISGQFSITRAGASVDQPLVVHIAMTGSAVNGVDYRTIPDTVTIAAGQSSVTITLTPISSGISLGLTKTATLNVQSDAAYNLGSPSSASITILDVSLSLSLSGSPSL